MENFDDSHDPMPLRDFESVFDALGIAENTFVLTAPEIVRQKTLDCRGLVPSQKRNICDGNACCALNSGSFISLSCCLH